MLIKTRTLIEKQKFG